MGTEPAASTPRASAERVPPYSEEAEKGVLGSILLDAPRVMDLCIERQLAPESFYVPAHRTVFEAMMALSHKGTVIDILTLGEVLTRSGELERIGGAVFLERLIDSTPTSAHAEYYIDIARQKHILRCVIDCARDAERECYVSEDSADMILGKTEQSFMDITERQHGFVTPWPDAVMGTMAHIETILDTGKGISGLSTGFLNLDKTMQGMKTSDMIVLAARPSMGKTSLAMNIAENVALGKEDPERKSRPVGIFSLEMSHEALVLRMLCSRARVSLHHLTQGYVDSSQAHGKLTMAASALSKAPIYLDDTGGLDIMELRARARRMKKKHAIELLMIDYLQLLHSKEYARQGRQIETAFISGNLKAMAKELKIPVLVLSQLSRAPEQREMGKPKLSDLRDSGAIEQDADVVCMLRRPCKYEGDPDHEDRTLAYVDVAKHRNGPTGEVSLNFQEEIIRFEDRAHGVDDMDRFPGPQADVDME